MTKKKTYELVPGKVPKPYIELLLEAVKFRKTDADVRGAMSDFLQNGGPLEHRVTPKRSYATLHRAYVRAKVCHERFCKAKEILDKWK